MRVSTGMIFETNVSSMQRQTGSLLHTQQQVSTGRRVLTPADDPVAAARALGVTQARDINTQYRTNQDNARTTLGLVEGQLAAAGQLIEDVQERAVQAGNATLSASDRRSIALELRARFDHLLTIANATDGTGQYLFAGNKINVMPFSGDVGAGVRYDGDHGRRALQVSASRDLAVSDDGDAIFMRVRDGNGSFATSAAGGNTGTGTIGVGNALGAYAGASFRIGFTPSAAPSGLDYVVTSPPGGAVVATGAFVSGAAIAFDGVNTVAIEGAPAAGDTFGIRPSAERSMFDTIAGLITALESASNSTQLANAVGAGLNELSRSLDAVLSVRASIGTRLQEVDALSNVGEDLHLQYEQALSRLQDVDYAQAISQLTREQMNLEAAQRSFMRISQLSLFNLL